MYEDQFNTWTSSVQLFVNRLHFHALSFINAKHWFNEIPSTTRSISFIVFSTRVSLFAFSLLRQHKKLKGKRFFFLVYVQSFVFSSLSSLPRQVKKGCILCIVSLIVLSTRVSLFVFPKLGENWREKVMFILLFLYNRLSSPLCLGQNAKSRTFPVNDLSAQFKI